MRSRLFDSACIVFCFYVVNSWHEEPVVWLRRCVSSSMSLIIYRFVAFWINLTILFRLVTSISKYHPLFG